MPIPLEVGGRGITGRYIVAEISRNLVRGVEKCLVREDFL